MAVFPASRLSFPGGVSCFMHVSERFAWVPSLFHPEILVDSMDIQSHGRIYYLNSRMPPLSKYVRIFQEVRIKG